MTNGIFTNVDEAVKAARKGYEELVKKPIAVRTAAIEAMKDGFRPYIDEMAVKTFEETKMGSVSAKVAKLNNAIYNTPGPEILMPDVETGDGGMVMYEHAAFGVIGAVTPSTNPAETVISNSIKFLAGGNTVYFSIHPGAKNISKWAVEKCNEFIYEATGLKNLIVTIEEPSLEAVDAMMSHPLINALVVTGGPVLVNQALRSGKKAFGAGEGNVPAMVDATADIQLAGKNIAESAAFDNNILCTSEKSCIAEVAIKDELIAEMQKHKALLITDEADIKKLMDTTIDGNKPARKFIGQDATFILDNAGVSYEGKPELIILEAAKDHPFVMIEMLMPILPIVSTKDFDDLVETAKMVEKGCRHTSTIHSRDLTHMNHAAKEMDTAIFVINGPSSAGTGVGDTGASALTICTTTGEGTTTAKTFTRKRRINALEGISVR
ncbi:MAG: aldehyde dehydrogenase [Vagococcus sp.]